MNILALKAKPVAFLKGIDVDQSVRKVRSHL